MVPLWKRIIPVEVMYSHDEYRCHTPNSTGDSTLYLGMNQIHKLINL